jgi:hypothetical protein
VSIFATVAHIMHNEAKKYSGNKKSEKKNKNKNDHTTKNKKTTGYSLNFFFSRV